jgi:hypothetical protein
MSIVSGDDAGDDADETAEARAGAEDEEVVQKSVPKGSAPKATSSVSIRRRTADAPVTLLLLPLRGDDAVDWLFGQAVKM